MSKTLSKLALMLSLIFVLSLFAAIHIHAQDASPSATLTPTETPSITPTPSPDLSPTPTPEHTPTPTPNPSTTLTPTPEPGNEDEGEVLAGATELGNTGSGKQMIKWVIAFVIVISVTLTGFIIARTNVDE